METPLERLTIRDVKIVARILSEHGITVSSPDEGSLDDLERERWNACIEIVKAIRSHQPQRKLR